MSNSSTTSFTCDVCGDNEAYHDSLGYEDYWFNDCVNGHSICDDDLLPLPEGYVFSAEELKHVRDYYGIDDEEELSETREFRYCQPAIRCPICQFHVIGEGDLARYLDRMTTVTRDEAFAEVKRGNARRKKLYTAEWIDFAARSLGKGRGDIVDEIKANYSDYPTFAAFLGESVADDDDDDEDME